MPLWPFRKRRSAATIRDNTTTEDTPAQHPADHSNIDANEPAIPVRRPSTRFSQRLGRRASQQTEKPIDPGSQDPQHSNIHSHATPTSIEERDVVQSTAPARGSVEDITALPLSYTLDRSPHLRPVDTERPHIPYNFRDHSTSQTSVQRPDTRPQSRPGTVTSKQSAYDTFPVRRRSSKKRKDDDRIRE